MAKHDPQAAKTEAMAPPTFLHDDPATLDADQLEAAVRYHNWRYFERDDAVIPDQIYDQLAQRLRALRPDSAVLDALSGQIGATGEGERVAHREPMRSLAKCYDHGELVKWAADIEGELVASPKLDGAAVSIRYDGSGRFELAATRGDGRRGEPIGHNVARIPGVPAQLPAAVVARAVAPIEVRGEVFMPLSAFAAVAEIFANPRNVAAGALKAKDAGGVAPESLAFLAYDLLGVPVERERDKGDVLRALGFAPAPTIVCTAASSAAIYDRLAAARVSDDFETDGVVFKVDNLALQQRLGATAHHPRWAIAWKFQGDSGESQLVEVQWSLSRNGTITPVAIVAPVELSGATVTRTTLHNLSNVERLALKIGDTLQLTRRGGVIPHVEGSRGGGSVDVVVPDRCPSCGEASVVRSSTRKVAGASIVTRTLHCSLPAQCPATLRGQLFHYTAALEIDGFGPKVLDLLLEAGLVRDAADLYRLTVDDLLILPRMGALSAAKLVANVEARRDVTLDAFLVALGIDALGRHAASLLSARWTLAELRQLTPPELASLHSLGEISAGLIVEGLRDCGAMIDRLEPFVRFTKPDAAPGEGALVGQTVVFTGKLERMGRRDAQQLVVRLGGQAGSTVTAETTLLVVGGDELESATPSSKLTKARKLVATGSAIEIISEDTFHARIAS